MIVHCAVEVQCSFDSIVCIAHEVLLKLENLSCKVENLITVSHKALANLLVPYSNRRKLSVPL